MLFNGVRGVGDLDLYGDAVGLPANHPRAERGLLVVPYEDLIAGPRVEARVCCARSVGDPALHNKIQSDIRRVVPEVIRA